MKILVTTMLLSNLSGCAWQVAQDKDIKGVWVSGEAESSTPRHAELELTDNDTFRMDVLFGATGPFYMMTGTYSLVETELTLHTDSESYRLSFDGEQLRVTEDPSIIYEKRKDPQQESGE